MVIALYGGSFNPPHLGHADAARVSLGLLEPEKLILIPVSVPPHKSLAPNSPTALERLELAQLAATDIPNAIVSDYEVMLGDKPSYSAQTAEHFAGEYPGARIVFLIGTDMLLTFEGWYEFERILAVAELAVFPRENGDLARIEKFSDYMREKYSAKITIIPKCPLPMTSSEIRAALPQRKGREMLSDAVYASIIKNRYYGAKPDFAWLREQAKSLLNPKRVPHVLGCEEEAVRLAMRWGEDPEDAAEAGILHDITKKLGAAEQLLLCEKYDIILDTTEKENPKLLHAKTGAELAKDCFGVSDRVHDAIFWHTTGRPEMTLLEKIIYMADYIEPNRNFEGVDTLRALAYKNIDEAMYLGLKMSMDDICQRGVVPHPRSIETLDWFLLKGRDIK